MTPQRKPYKQKKETQILNIGSLDTTGQRVADFLSSGRGRGAVSRVDADMRELADTVPHKMWFSGSHGVLFLNARFFEYTCLAPEQVLGMQWTIAVHPDDLDVCTDRNARDQAVRDHQPWRFEYRLRRYDGEYRWHVARTVPLFDSMGQIRRWVGTATDIHEEKVAAEKQRRFVREVLASVTEDRLRLCDAEEDLPVSLANRVDDAPILLSRQSLSAFRSRVTAACEAMQMPPLHTADLVLAAGEAALNAVVHGGGGEGHVYVSEETPGSVQVWVTDRGDGIAEDSLHRATLERGYTTAGTLGQGFPLLLRTADRVYLLTGAGGTVVVVEKDGAAPNALSPWA